MVFLPVFFAGVNFATSFRDSQRLDVDIRSNVGGVILSELSESLSVIGGFPSLLWVAIVYCLLSALFRHRKGVAG